jgi:hypothetical protein
LFRGHLSTPSKYAHKDDFAVTSTPTLEGGRVFASDDAAATVTAARTVADGGIDGPPPRRVSPHAASSMLENGITIKTEPRILVFRHNTRYFTFTFVVDHSMF